jgi:hypothetical protein
VASEDDLLEKVVAAILDCEAAGPITRSAAIVVAKAVLEAINEWDYPPEASDDE